MPLFSQPVIDFWQEPLRNGTLLYKDDDFTLVSHGRMLRLLICGS
ncbi:hypothetical protein SAMN04488522_104248 [Pedobacter caeni]|uniref:Uncharacterized protein n=1 Tax=Pedobacter caeni TaxID=288992 RepID=A0A1M5GJT0_9SPHI|nr:hypothetical protein SAMN04488522_104248 [Pedobacter caeni]